MPRAASTLLATLLACTIPVDSPLYAHGSVTPDEDRCIIRIGYFEAHFKVYLPESHQHRDFCEDLPAIGDSIFVMEYEHDGLASVPIDFRIIRNVTGQGRFTNADHVAAIGNLDDVTQFDSSAGRDPLEFALGGGQVIPGFDNAVDGIAVGDSKTVTIPPEEAYGQRHEQLVQQVSRSALPDEIEPAVGMQLQSQSPEGQVMMLVVTEVEEESITVDANHPLAGQALTFDIELVEIV